MYYNINVNKNNLIFFNHKILDLIGDLAVLGKPVKGHFIANKSGHVDNAKLVNIIKVIYFS
ncbi:UDP-3-O-acyl-N-acetylglucosamine deacetylase [Candidatus Margulisiibacteriota bacterium]